MDGNWTYQQARDAMLSALIIERKQSVTLNMAGADADNVNDVVAWAKSLGYDAMADDMSESVKISMPTTTTAFTTDDAVRAARLAIDRKNDLLDDWLELDPESLEKSLRIAAQRTARERRSSDLSVPATMVAYWTGYQSGCEEILMHLYRERMARKSIQDALDAADAAGDPHMENILRFLYQQEKPVRHPEMAQSLNMSYKELTEAMKAILACRAAESYRTGRNTRYELTRTARRLCRDLYGPDETKEPYAAEITLAQIRGLPDGDRLPAKLRDDAVMVKPLSDGMFQIMCIPCGEPARLPSYRSLKCAGIAVHIEREADYRLYYVAIVPANGMLRLIRAGDLVVDV